MSYSQLVLSDRPYGYWESPQFSDENLLTDNQYSLESSTSGWSAVDSNTSISRTTSDAYIGSASLLAYANSSDPIETRVSSGSRIQIIPGVRYSMIARVKRVTGSRNASIRIEYFTTQSGSTLSESVRVGEEFELSDSEWTTIYHTDLVATPNEVDYFMSWGVITDSGDIGDEIIIDGIQFYEGSAYKLLDHAKNNNADIYESYHENIKPIIFGTAGSTKLYDNSNIIIPNTYNLFISGTEDKQATIDFWFTIEKPPEGKHNLLSVGSFIKCYIERDRIFIDSGSKSSSIQVVDWESQHYVAICYADRKLDLYLDNREPVSVLFDEDYQFPDLVRSDLLPNVIFGPSSSPINKIYNPSFNSGTTNWQEVGIGTSISTIFSDSKSGQQCLEVTKASVEDSGIEISNRIRVSEYRTYQASVYVKMPSGQPTANIELVCNEYESIDSSTPITSHSDQYYLSSSDDWQRISLGFTANAKTRYIDFKVVQPTAGATGDKFLVDAALVEESSHLREWTELSDKSDPLFISAIGIYPYHINSSQISKRIEYATKDLSDALSIKYSADRIDPIYNSVYSVKEIDVADIKSNSNVYLQNLIYTNNGLYVKKMPPVSVTSGPSGGYYYLDSLGIKFTNDCQAIIESASAYFSPFNSTIKFQTELDTNTGDGTILTITPIVGYYALVLLKESNSIICRLVSDFDDASPLELFTTQTLTDAEYNIAINFSEGKIDAIVGSEEFNNISIPSISSPTQIFIGNLPGTSSGYPDYIRNFGIDQFTEFANIDWYDPGLYMLRFNGSLNVSQRAIFEYEIPAIDYSNNTIITFNEATKPDIIINNSYVDEISYVPGMNYSAPELISFYATAITENAYEDAPKFNNIYISAYTSDSIYSSLGNFQLTRKGYDPYIIKSIDSNVLSHDSNVGIKFIRDVSSGAEITSPSDLSYEVLEFIFKIDKYPNRGESYTVFDLDGLSSNNLLYSDAGLAKNGTYQLFIDGDEVTDISTIDIVVGEFYHVIAKFTSGYQSIFFGNDKNDSNGINGSIGKISIYEVSPPNISEFAIDKYQDLIGKITNTISGGSININDEPSSTQQYYRDSNNEYYEMLDLPKVKFVVSSWEEIDLDN